MQLPPDFEIDVRVPERKLTDEEVKELNVRLNRNVAEWDFDVLANEFDLDELRDWGFDEKELRIFDDPEEEIIGEVEFTNELLEEHNYIVLYFENSIDWLQVQTLFNIKAVKALDSKGVYERKGVGRVVKGSDFLNKLGLDL
jgi:hypothetical protein